MSNFPPVTITSRLSPPVPAAVAISGDFTLEAGVDYTLAAIGDGANQSLELLPFVDDNVPAASGAKVRIAHLSPFAADIDATKVDLCTDDGAVVAAGLPYKGVINPVLPAGDYDLKIAVAGTDCMTVALDLPSIRLADGDIFELYAIGIPGGAIPFTVAAHPDLVLTPEEPGKATITIAVDANPQSVRNFRFEGDLGKFRLDDANPDDGDAIGSSESFEVEPGTYSVKQLVPYRWTLQGIVCENGSTQRRPRQQLRGNHGRRRRLGYVHLQQSAQRLPAHSQVSGIAMATARATSSVGWKASSSSCTVQPVRSSIPRSATSTARRTSTIWLLATTRSVKHRRMVGPIPSLAATAAIRLTVGPKRIVVLRFGNAQAGTVSAAAAPGNPVGHGSARRRLR